MTDEELWNAFVGRTLPEPSWNHQTHLRVAWLHLARWQLDEAQLRMRVGIIRLNLTHGLEETPERGYHETMTRFWLHAVALARHADAEKPIAVPHSSAFCELHPELLDKTYPLHFYTRHHLMSLQARAIFVEPDRQALPAIPI